MDGQLKLESLTKNTFIIKALIIKTIYHLIISCYTLAIKITAIFNSKAKAWVNGRKSIFKIIRNDLKKTPKTVWIHCASLGEFEQGRPIIEKYRYQNPKDILVLTFFSPSGYELRKDYEVVDFVYYLPADTLGNARQFINLLNPKLVLFVKYEFWFGYLHEIKKREIEAYLISAKFNPNSYLFKWYGKLFVDKLRAFKTIFVQDQTSSDLAKKNNLKAIITGDTRFDRVKLIADKNEKSTLIENFLGNDNQFVVIGGSTWPPEEKIMAQWFSTNDIPIKWIIAPHDISKSHIDEIQNRFGKDVVKYSQLSDQKTITSNVLIIDNIGILSKIYKYATLAIIGGGFGEGIHNTQEAIVHGIPVLFGPKYQKFKEATDLVGAMGAFSFKDSSEFKTIFENLLNNKTKYLKACEVSKSYVQANLGATEKVMRYINNDIS